MTIEQATIAIAGPLILILLGIIAYFLQRLVSTIDTVAKEVYDLKAHLNIIQFLEKRIEDLEQKCASLEKAFNAVDKWIYSLRAFNKDKDKDSDQ